MSLRTLLCTSLRTIALLGLVAGVAHATRRENLLLANCPREAGEYTGTYRGSVLLHKELLAHMPGDGVRTSIEHQLRYLWGHYRNDAEAHAALQMSLGAELPEIRVLAQHDVQYGRDLALPYATKEKRLALDDPYTLAAVEKGHVRKTDPAVLIEYEISFRLAMCGRGADPVAEDAVPLPPDPWLAYWYVPKRLHRPLAYHGDRAITNPCSDDDFADLPHPFYYWYDWLPTRHGPDDDGRAFDCRTILKKGDHYSDVAVRYERIGVAGHDFARLRKELGEGKLTATIVVGAVDHSVKDLGLAEWQEVIGSGGDLEARATNALDKWPHAKTKEAGTRAFFGVLRDLSGVMNVATHTSRVEGEYLLVEVEGKLKQSGRAMRVKLFVGPTDLFGPVVPTHFPILRRAITEDQIVVYWGHSGIGENFRLAQIEEHVGITHAQMSAELARSPLRLTAFISCYSYMYFGQDLLAAGAEREEGGTFVFTGMESAKHEAGPLAVLDLVDDILRPDNSKGRVERLSRLGNDEFWLIKEVGKNP